MKKIILGLVMALVLSCLLVTAVSADTVVPSSSNEYGTLTTFDEPIGNTNISQLGDNGAIARTVLFDGTNYYTVPTTYVLTESPKNRGDMRGEMFLLSFEEIGKKLEKTFNKSSIIRCEFPSGIAFTAQNNESLSGCANLIEVVVNNGLRFWENKQFKAFTNCKKLEYADLSGIIIEYPQCAFALFEYCDKLEHVKLPNAYFNGESYVEMDTDHMFSGCYELTTIDNFEGFFKNEKTLDYKTFYNCWALKEIALWDGLETIEGRAIGNCKAITTMIIPDSVTVIGTNETVFESCTSLKTLVLPKKASFGSYCFEKCTALTDVWMPTEASTFSGQVFGQCNNNGELAVNFYFATAESTVTIKDMNNNKDPFISAINGGGKAKIIYSTPLSTKCEVFLGGHALSGNATMQVVDFFKDICFGDTCTRQGCGTSEIDASKTIGAIFVNYGYSVTEGEIGGKLSMSQFFGIDKANLEKYTTLTGNAFEYGFVVSSNADPMNEANSGLIAEGKTHITEQSKFAHDYFIVTVSGFITEGEKANVDKDLTFCVYVKDGEKLSYLDNGETVEVVEMKSYNDIVVLTGNK